MPEEGIDDMRLTTRGLSLVASATCLVTNLAHGQAYICTELPATTTVNSTRLTPDGKFVYYSAVGGGLVKMNTATGQKTVMDTGLGFIIRGTNQAGDVVGSRVLPDNSNRGFVIRNGVYSEPGLTGSYTESRLEAISGDGTAFGQRFNGQGTNGNFAQKADGTIITDTTLFPVTAATEDNTVATSTGASSTIWRWNGSSLEHLRDISSYAVLGMTNGGVSLIGHYTTGPVIPQLAYIHSGVLRNWVGVKGSYTATNGVTHYGNTTSISGVNTARYIGNFDGNYSDLISLVQNKSSWLNMATVTSVGGGLITGTAHKSNGALRSYIMTPVPEPSSIMLLLGGIAFIFRRKK